MSEIKFEMKPVTEKRPETHRKGSKYDSVIDRFIEGGHDLVEITFEDQKTSYMVSNLKKRIEKRKLDMIVSRAGDFIYLEKSKGK